MRVFARAVRALAAVLAVLPAVPATAADSFYDDLERQGIRAAAAGDPAHAVKLLRLACFGLLEEPPRLAACLAHLLTAQAGAGDEEGFERSLKRLLEVDQRFQGYSRAELSESVRSRPELRFYSAVALFEAGDAARAATVLDDCLPRLPVNDFIRAYAERIRRTAAGE
jgi:hypothetical protein